MLTGREVFGCVYGSFLIVIYCSSSFRHTPTRRERRANRYLFDNIDARLKRIPVSQSLVG